MRAFASWSLLPLLLLLMSGCPHRFDFGPNPVDDAGELLARSEALLATPSTLQGEARLRFRLPQGRFGADHLVALAVPDRLRLDTLSFFGSPLSVLLLREGELLLWDIEGGKAYRGPATSASLAQVLPIVLDPNEVIDLVLGRPPRSKEARTKLVLDHAARAYRVDLKDAAGKAQAWIDPKEGVLLRYRVEPDSGEGWEVSYEDYRPAVEGAEGLLPFTVRYQRGETGLIWNWRNLEADGSDFGAGLFELALPTGVVTIPLEAGPATWLPPEAPVAAPAPEHQDPSSPQ